MWQGLLPGVASPLPFLAPALRKRCSARNAEGRKLQQRWGRINPAAPRPPATPGAATGREHRHGRTPTWLWGSRLRRGAQTPVALSPAPKVTLSLPHRWPCPQPHRGSCPTFMGALIPAPRVTLSLPHRWPCLSPVPSPTGAPVPALGGSQTPPSAGDPSPGPSAGSEHIGAGGRAGCQPHHGPPCNATWTPPASQHPAPHAGHRGSCSTHQHPAPSQAAPGLGGGSRGTRTGCHWGWDDAAASPPQPARILFTGSTGGGCPPTPEQSQHPKKSPRSGPGAAAVPRSPRGPRWVGTAGA